MNVPDQLAAELARLAGYSGPGTAVAAARTPDGATLEAELASVDNVGCLVVEVRAAVPKLAGANVGVLKAWGESLSRRITYLLETLSLLEADEEHGQVLIRSNPPDRHGSATAFYEVLLREDGPGLFGLRRYESRKGVPGRVAVPMQLTRQVLERLFRDLAETLPAGP